MKRHLLIAVSFVLTASACAEEQPTINRVQPNYIKKADLVGLWYYGRTIVGVPAADGFTFVGDGSWDLKRVRFDVQENILYIRRMTEMLKGGDNLLRRAAEGRQYEGEVVGAFRILKHFDIAQPYNSATGEKLNILAENAIDRPWSERDYMRVDWSKNQVVMADDGFDVQRTEPVNYYVQDPEHPDAPKFVRKELTDAQGEMVDTLDYFDITTRMFAAAGTYTHPSWGTIPLCWFYDHQFEECGPGEYTLRNSFLRIKPDSQYEPRSYKGTESELFGYFQSERLVYDRAPGGGPGQEGIRHQNKEQLINRHNIWEKTIEPNGDPMAYAARTGKPLVYHVNEDWPSEADDPVINASARQVADQWNDVFSGVVTQLGASMPAGGRMFVFCPNNPTQIGDPVECGEPGYFARLGDIRHSFMAYLPDYMTYGLLGLGPSNTDTDTGEIISGMAYVYHHNDTAAWDVTEMIELLSGSREADTYIDGTNLEDWVERFHDNRRTRFSSRHSVDDAEHMIEKMVTSENARSFDARRQPPSEEDEADQRKRGFDAWLADQLPRFENAGVVRRKNGAAQARLNSLVGTPVEGMLMQADNYLGFGYGPDSQPGAGANERASVLRDGFGGEVAQRQKMFEDWAASRNMYTRGMADDALMGLAREYADSGLNTFEIYNAVRGRIFSAVLAHEVGHSIGLMHNFGASDDALNYFPEYWEIRSQDGTVGPRVGANADEITDYEINNSIYNYAYTSVMDYAGTYTIDGTGLGRYDNAAVYWGYGNLVEVYEDHGDVEADTLVDWWQDQGEVMGWANSGPTFYHYTNFYDEMGDKMWRDDNRVWTDFDDFVPETEEARRNANYGRALKGPQAGKLRIPYIYCSHGRSDLGDSCLTRDSGADPAERLKNILDKIDTWYIARNFPRGKVSSRYYWWNYVPRYYRRTYDRIKQWHDVYGLYNGFLPQYYDADQLRVFFSDAKNGWGTQTWGVQAGFNHLVKTLLMPDITDYGPEVAYDGSTLLKEWPFNGGESIELGVANARYYSTAWSRGSNGERNCGYFWWDCLHHVGFYLDKIMAIYALSDSETNYIGRSTPEDLREWQIGFYSTFSDQIHSVNNAIMSQDWSKVGPYVEDGELRWPNYAGALDTVHDAPLNPYATFTVQLYWQVLGLARFQNTYDQRFLEENQVWVEGGGVAPELAAENKITWVDPVTGTIYGSRRGDPGSIYGGQLLLERAADMELYSTYCDDGSGNCLEPQGDNTREGVSAELRKASQLISALATIQRRMRFGNPFAP